MSIDDIRDSLVMVQRILTRPDDSAWVAVREAEARIQEINQHFNRALNDAMKSAVQEYEKRTDKEVE
jgi:hypothetical protein